MPATVTGELIAAGWSASMGYPGIKLDTEGDTVHGMKMVLWFMGKWLGFLTKQV